MWETIENKINRFLCWLKRILGIQWVEDTFKSIVAKIKAKQAGRSQKLKEGGISFSKRMQTTITKTLASFRKINVKKIKFSAILTFFVAVLIPLAKKIKIWYLALKPTTIAIFSLVSAAGVIGGIGVYKSVKEINEKTQVKQEVKEEVFYGKKRRDYHNVDAKQLLVYQVSIPIYIENATDVRSLIIDFTIQMSNRYLKEYFYKNDHLIKDRLGHSMEEIVPGFPLTLEGQQIIKEKILKEVNGLIKELEIKGQAKEVFFNSILAG